MVEGEEISGVAGPLPLDVRIFVETLGKADGSSVEDVWFARAAVRSASFVSEQCKLL
jgi:hypothetical protein